MAAADASRVLDATREALVKRRLKLREYGASLGKIRFPASVALSRSRDVGPLLSATAALLEQAKARGGMRS